MSKSSEYPPLKVRIMLRIYLKSNNMRLRGWLRKRIARATGGFAYSQVLRDLYKNENGIEIGYGTYGGIWDISSVWWQNIKVGNYCSFSSTIRIYTANHRTEWFSTHPCLANPTYGSVLYNGYPKTGKEHGLEIGHDVWMGEQAIITPGCRKVGNGAIIGSGSIVTHDVPPYAIVAGNPAKILRYRFDQETIAKLEATQWWLLTIDELRKVAPEIQAIAMHENTHI